MKISHCQTNTETFRRPGEHLIQTTMKKLQEGSSVKYKKNDGWLKTFAFLKLEIQFFVLLLFLCFL